MRDPATVMRQQYIYIFYDTMYRIFDIMLALAAAAATATYVGPRNNRQQCQGGRSNWRFFFLLGHVWNKQKDRESNTQGIEIGRDISLSFRGERGREREKEREREREREREQEREAKQ